MVSSRYSEVGKRVRSYRKQKGLSQDELAEGICSRQTVSILENGVHFPSIEIMQSIADKLGVPLQEIVIDQEEELHIKIKVDMIKVYVERGDYPDAIPLAEETLKCDDLLEYQRREVLICLAECFIRTGRADQAVQDLTELQQRMEQGRDRDDQLLAIIYDKMGTAYFFLSKIVSAHAHYMRAYQLTLRFPQFDLTAAKITYNLGMACRFLNNHSDAVEYLSKAQGFFKNVSDLKRLAQTMFELGIVYQMCGHFDSASDHFQESLSLYQSLNIMNMVWQVKESYAFNVLVYQNVDKALEELSACVKEFELNSDSPQIAFVYARIAYLLIGQHRLSQAREYLEQARNLFSEEEIAENPRFAYVYQVMALYKLQVKEYDTCIEFAIKSAKTYDKLNLERDAAESLKLCAEAYRQRQMYKEADKISQRVIELLDREQSRLMSRLEAFSR
jgi:HTH-type transcriptional regulator, quorum sensing regulator NprR